GDRDQGGGGHCVLTAVGHDDRHHVAEVGCAAALRDEDGPVLVDDPDAEGPGDVGGSEGGHHAGCGQGRGGVDAADDGAGVRGQPGGGVHVPRHPQVVHAAAVPRG